MKKIFLSLSAIALLAVGTVSCSSSSSSDDTPPGPGPELTENFISVNGEQFETGTTRWYVRTNGNTPQSPVMEYPKSETDSTLVAVYDLITWDADEDRLVNFIYTVEVDMSQPAGSDERTYYPFTYNSQTGFEPETELIAAYYVEGDKDYAFNPVPTVNISSISYQNSTLAYTTSGKAGAFNVAVDFNGEATGMYIFDVSDDKKSSNSFKPQNIKNLKSSKLVKSSK